MAKWIRIIHFLFLALWLAVFIESPVFKASARFFGWPDFQARAVQENRILTAHPDLKHLPLREWGHAIDAWYDDNFAWRSDIIRLYRTYRFFVAMYPIGDQVPGYRGMIFRRNGTWPEIEDYLGAIRVDEQMRKDWRTLLEGRVAWADAHGAHYIEAVAPVKAQVHPERAPWTIRKFSGHSSRLQLIDAMKGSFAETNVLYFTDDFRREALEGRELFYPEDHHVNPYGCWKLYCGIIGRLRELWYPWLTITPYYDEPPPEVRSKTAMGAWTDWEKRRLEVSAPGYTPQAVPELGISLEQPNYPACPIYVKREGEGLYLAMRNDSLLRFPLSSWSRRGDVSSVALPFGDSFSDIAMFIFKRFNTKELEDLVAPRVPDIIIEEFPECKISLGVFDLDETMRRAAAWGNAIQLETAPEKDVQMLALGTFENAMCSGEDKTLRAYIMDSNGKMVASETFSPGVRRAIFFGAIQGNPPFSLALAGGTAIAQRLDLRIPADDPGNEAVRQ